MISCNKQDVILPQRRLRLILTRLLVWVLTVFSTSPLPAREGWFSGFSASNKEIRVTNPGDVRVLADKAYFAALIPALREAKRSIHLVMFIFKSGERQDNRPAQVEKELIAARQRGVEVEVILERSGYDEGLNRENSEVIRDLKKAGVSARFDAGNQTTHAKIVVVDSRFCFVGSHNMTHAALAQNHEMTLLIDSEPLAKELEGYIKKL